MNPVQVSGAAPINLMDGVPGFAASRPAKFRDLNRKTFRLHLKECPLFQSPSRREPSHPAQIAPAKTD